MRSGSKFKQLIDSNYFWSLLFKRDFVNLTTSIPSLTLSGVENVTKWEAIYSIFQQIGPLDHIQPWPNNLFFIPCGS